MQNRFSFRLGIFAVFVLAAAVSTVVLLLRVERTQAQAVLSEIFPPDAQNMELDISAGLFGRPDWEFSGHARFELSQEQAQQWFQNPAFQCVKTSPYPLTNMYDDMIERFLDIAAAAYRYPPEWWQPHRIQNAWMGYRSGAGDEPGPDSAWFMADISDPTKPVTVYVFFVETKEGSFGRCVHAN